MTPAAIDPWHAPSTVLRALGQDTCLRLAEMGTEVSYDAGAAILREGEPTPFLGVVVEGRVGLRLSVPERGDQTVVTIEPGELVGWSAVVPPYRASANAVALEPTRLLAFDAARLRDLLATDREAAAELLPILLATMSDRLMTSWHQLLDLFAGQAAEPW